MDQKLTTQALNYNYGKKKLLDNINLEFTCGHLHGILGPNGSGKSTLLKTLSHIWLPTSGAVYWNGKLLNDQKRLEISRLITLVPQNPQPAFDFLVEDIVAMGRYSHGSSYWSKKEKSFVYESLEAVDAIHLRSRLVNQLSQGEKQRVYIARALVTESPVLLLDEPTSSLDIQHQLEIWKLLQEQVKKGKVVIATTHDLSLAKYYCDQIAVLNKGICLGQGTFNSLITNELLQKVFGVVESPQNNCTHYSLTNN